ncbi:bestrophin family protein [Flagellimonas sp. S174]|uniref:bestrophin family protein n=1 Tax=Flagellimonas sp. S174 TaxID=3410790 RepID=UPI003BF57B98
MITKISSNRMVWLLAIIVYLWKYLLFILLLSSTVYVLFEFKEIKGLGLKGAIPIGILGTALSIFLSFRNNSAYDRWWEARKIWGGIVNSSRTFAIQVLTYISNHNKSSSKLGATQIQKSIIYRHIAYINALRLNLRNQQGEYHEVLKEFLTESELKKLLTFSNVPTQIIHQQSQHLKQILNDSLIEDFRLYEMMNTLAEFYNLQGKAERIKKTPFPMYYDFFIQVFVFIFVCFLPVALIGLFEEIAVDGSLNWLVIPTTMIVSFMFIVIEKTGSFTETPFENKNEDVPLTSLCRTIEIDLREMIRDTDIPLPIQKQNILIDGEVLM